MDCEILRATMKEDLNGIISRNYSPQQGYHVLIQNGRWGHMKFYGGRGGGGGGGKV